MDGNFTLHNVKMNFIERTDAVSLHRMSIGGPTLVNTVRHWLRGSLKVPVSILQLQGGRAVEE